MGRQPSTQDRRRNVVTLTEHGQRLFEAAAQAERAVERDYVGHLGAREQQQLHDSLRAVVTRAGGEDG